MPLLSISEVGHRMGLRPSAIRYYEQIGILPDAQRSSGQRRYDTTVLHRLAIIQRARQTGFTLEEIRELFFGFSDKTPASGRWRKLSRRKLTELERQMDDMKAMQQLLQSMIDRCCCKTLDQCGKGIFTSGYSEARQKLARRKRLLRQTSR
jgi:MerR family redox-sensitive transcriptional activator SoxR